MPKSFIELVRTKNAGEISREDLRALSNVQLEAYSKLLGLAYTGTKNTRVNRIFKALTVRHFLRNNEPVEYYANNFSRRTLVDYVKKADLFVGSTRYGLAVGLKNWQMKCRREGQIFLNEMRAEAAKHPQQVRLF